MRNRTDTVLPPLIHHIYRAVKHKGVVQLWDLFTDGAWRGSRRLPRYLPVALLLPLPHECRSVALHGSLAVRARHGVEKCAT
jgi:hypothetical protein